MKSLIEQLDLLLEPELTEDEQECVVEAMLEADVSELEELALFADEDLQALGLSEGIISKLKAKFRARMIKGARATQRKHADVAKTKGIHTPEGAKAHFKAVKAGAKVDKARSARREHLSKVVGHAFSKEKNVAARRVHARAALYQRQDSRGKDTGASKTASKPAARAQSGSTNKDARRAHLLAKISPKVGSHISSMSAEKRGHYVAKKASKLIGKVKRHASAAAEFANAKTHIRPGSATKTAVGHIKRKPLPRHGTPWQATQGEENG